MKRALLILCLTVAASGLTACGNLGGANETQLVQQAYNTPGMVKIKPYTRSIFNTTDF